MAITVTEINVYPVKSLRGISLDASVLTTRGLQFDRRFMLVAQDHEFMTQRQLPLMATIATEIVGETLSFVSPFGDRVSVPLQPPLMPTRTVTVWSSNVPAHSVSAEADTFFSDYFGTDVRLVYMPDTAERFCSPQFARNNEIVSFADGYPVLIASMSSLDDLNARIVGSGGTAVPINRFRANIVVSGAEPFAEDGWEQLQIGDITLRNAKPCVRCQVTTTDQGSGEVRGPEPLQTLSTFRNAVGGPKFGVNLLPVTLGRVRVGDVLSVVPQTK